jgi:hypothetical protein
MINVVNYFFEMGLGAEYIRLKNLKVKNIMTMRRTMRRPRITANKIHEIQNHQLMVAVGN